MEQIVRMRGEIEFSGALLQICVTRLAKICVGVPNAKYKPITVGSSNILTLYLRGPQRQSLQSKPF